MINLVQAELFAQVKAIAGLNVYGHVPQGSDYPYVIVDPMKLSANDYDSEIGFTGTIMIHVWSDSKSMNVVSSIQMQIYNALHRIPMTVVGWGISTVQQEFTEILLDPDGITRHGVQRFRVIFEPTA